MELNIQIENPIHPEQVKPVEQAMFTIEEEALKIHLLMKERRNKANILYEPFTNPTREHILGSEMCLGFQEAGPR